MHFLKNDEIAKLDFNDLKDLFFKVRSAIQIQKRIYYCYVSREMQNREFIKRNISAK